MPFPTGVAAAERGTALAQELFVQLASVVILGISAQWLAWRLRLPSILLLLIFGFLAGPATGLLDPDALFGDVLLPLVSLSVAVILFEGGLNLRLSGLREAGGVVRNLITIGLLATWLFSAAAAHLVLGFSPALATLLGAILVVTGPTVIGPLLRQIRPRGQVAQVAKWEGILNDPVGAILAVLVFEAIIAGGIERGILLALLGILRALLVGGLIGAMSGGAMILLLRRYWVPDYLQSPLTLMIVTGGFTISNLVQGESGLLAVTVMGIVLANQQRVPVKHISEFKENLAVLLISSLFILLAARLRPSDMAVIGAESFAFLAILVLVVRPGAVALSAIGSDLSARERVFLGWMAPRGIVAAAVASVFALELTRAGHPEAARLVPVTFLVIIGTVTIYGLTATPLARWLGIATPNPQGALIIGAHPWARAIAGTLQEQNYPVLVVDTVHPHIAAARMAGLPTHYASILSETVLDEIDLGGIGRLLALTDNDEVNALAALHFADVFGRAEVYQLPLEGSESTPSDEISQQLRGRLLFGAGMTYARLTAHAATGAVIKKTHLTEQFDFKAFQELYGENAIPLFLIMENGDLTVFTADDPPEPRPGQKLISLVAAVEGAPMKTPHTTGTQTDE